MRTSREAVVEEDNIRQIFARISGSIGVPISRDILSVHLANTRDMTLEDAAMTVSNMSDNGHLVEIIVEIFPDMNRRFYLIPGLRSENPGKVFVPFWSYVCTEVVPNTTSVVTSDLCEQIVERAEGDIPKWVLTAVDEHLEKIVPVTTGFQSMSGRTLQADTVEVYETMAESHGPSEGLPDRYF